MATRRRQQREDEQEMAKSNQHGRKIATRLGQVKLGCSNGQAWARVQVLVHPILRGGLVSFQYQIWKFDSKAEARTIPDRASVSSTMASSWFAFICL